MSSNELSPTHHSPLAGARVVLGVTGSIAAYKAVALASALTQAEAIVDVILTREAAELVRPLSFQAITHRPAHTDLFGLLAETEIGHVTLGHEADVVVVASGSATTCWRRPCWRRGRRWCWPRRWRRTCCSTRPPRATSPRCASAARSSL